MVAQNIGEKNLLSHWNFPPIITGILHCERLTCDRRIPQLKRKLIVPNAIFWVQYDFFGFNMIFFQGLDFG